MLTPSFCITLVVSAAASCNQILEVFLQGEILMSTLSGIKTKTVMNVINIKSVQVGGCLQTSDQKNF